MNILHLLWLIPVSLFVGGIIGYGICAYRVICGQAKEYEKLHRNDN